MPKQIVRSLRSCAEWWVLLLFTASLSILREMLQRLGGCEKIEREAAMVAAEKLAAESDVVVIAAGLSPDWESEGSDRPTLDMPGPQNELIARVAKANPNTVVCVQAVSPPERFHFLRVLYI